MLLLRQLPKKMEGGTYESTNSDNNYTRNRVRNELIPMLEKDFKIDLTRDEIIHIYSLKTEHDINAAVKAILNDRWK